MKSLMLQILSLLKSIDALIKSSMGLYTYNVYVIGTGTGIPTKMIPGNPNRRTLYIYPATENVGMSVEINSQMNPCVIVSAWNGPVIVLDHATHGSIVYESMTITASKTGNVTIIERIRL